MLVPVSAYGGGGKAPTDRDLDQMADILTSNETLKVLKKVCDTKFPQYSERNEQAYRNSPYSRISSEQALELFVEPNRRASLLRSLEDAKRSTTEDLQRATEEVLDQYCVNFPYTVIRIGTW